MTNEQKKAKELAELLNAFADGKQLEWFNQSHWIEIPIACSLKNFLVDYNVGVPYRIKPKTKRVPLTMQDLIERELRKDTMRVKFNGTSMFITDFNDTGAWISGEKHEYEAFMFCYTFLDGTPCYKEV